MFCEFDIRIYLLNVLDNNLTTRRSYWQPAYFWQLMKLLTDKQTEENQLIKPALVLNYNRNVISMR